MIVDLADDAEDVGDAYVTLLVHAGIAAADVICRARLGDHASGESHWEARDLLGRVNKRLADDLGIVAKQLDLVRIVSYTRPGVVFHLRTGVKSSRRSSSP